MDGTGGITAQEKSTLELLYRTSQQVDLYSIPPDPTVLNNFESAVKVGTVPLATGVTRILEPISLKPVANQPIPLRADIESISELGFGHVFAFKFGLFTFLLGFLPVLLYSIVVGAIYSTGQDCLSLDQVNHLKAKVQGYEQFDQMKQIWPKAPIYRRIQMYAKNRGLSNYEASRNQQKGRLLGFALTSCRLTNDDPNKCAKLLALNCAKNAAVECRMIALDLLIKRIIRQTCVRNMLSLTSAGNYSSKFRNLRYWVDGLELLTIFSWLFLILYFYRDMVASKHLARIEHPKVEHYSLLVKNLQKANLENIPVNRLDDVAEEFPDLVRSVFDSNDAPNNHGSPNQQPAGVELQNLDMYQSRPLSVQDFSISTSAGLLNALRITFENSLAHLGKQVQVSSITLCFDTKEYEKLHKQIRDYKTKIAKLQFDHSLGLESETEEELDKELANKPRGNAQVEPATERQGLLGSSSKTLLRIQQLKQLISEKEIELKACEFSFSLGASSPLFLGSAYLTFESMEDKELIYHTYVARERFFSQILANFGAYSSRLLRLATSNSSERKFILVDSAAGPEDIAWSNLALNFRSRHYRQCLNMLLIIAVMVANLWMIYETKNYLSRLLSAKSGEDHMPKYNPVIIAFLGNFVMAVCTLILNTLLGKLITYMIEFHGLPTETSFTLTKVKLIWRAQFVMKAIIPAVAASLVLDVYGENGYIYTVFSNIAKYALVVPILARVTNIDVWVSQIERKMVEGFINNPKSNPKYTLREAADLWVDDVFFASSLLTKYLRSLATIVFVAPIFPMAAIFYPILGIQTHYSYKYALLRQSKKGPAFADKIVAETVDELLLCVICFILGCIFRDFSFGLNEFQSFQLRPIHLTLLLFMVVFIAMKARKLVKKSIQQQDKSLAPDYSEILKKSPLTYAYCNPAYKRWLQTLSRAT